MIVTLFSTHGKFVVFFDSALYCIR